MMGGSHGIPCSALPGHHGWMGAVNLAGVNAVATRLEDSLSWLQRGPKKPSNGHTSSRGGGDSSLKAEIETVVW